MDQSAQRKSDFTRTNWIGNGRSQVLGGLDSSKSRRTAGCGQHPARPEAT